MGEITNAELSFVTFDVDQDKINLYADITDDYNPLHVDPEFAATTRMGGVIAHGTMSLALIWQMLRLNFGAERCGEAEINVRFVRPVRVGDHLVATGTIKPDGLAEVWIANQNGEKVIEGTATL